MDFQTPLEMEAALSRGTSTPKGLDNAAAERELAAAASVAAEAAAAASGPYVPVFPMQTRGFDANAFPAQVVDPEAEKVKAEAKKKIKDLVTSSLLSDEYERLSVAVRANVTPGYPFALNRSAYDENHNLDAITDSLLQVEAKHRRQRDKTTDWRDVFLMYENMRKRVLRDNQLLQQRQGMSRR